VKILVDRRVHDAYTAVPLRMKARGSKDEEK
jgi:hypothetical protein